MDDDLDDTRDGTCMWLQEVCVTLGVSFVSKISEAKCSSALNKGEMCRWLVQALGFMDDQNKHLRELRLEKEELKNQLISSQKEVVRLQDELLSSKTEQLQNLQNVVKTSVPRWRTV